MYTSERARYGRLQEAYMCNAVSKGNKRFNTDDQARRPPNWWVDSSYAVHPDMHSHIGIYLTLGKGVVYSGSTKQKLDTKSSMEAELVVINEAVGQILWHLIGEGV